MKSENNNTRTTVGRVKREGVSSRSDLPIIGDIRIGEKQMRGTKEIPVSLDYFKATGNYAKLFTQQYGEKPDNIQIVFISNDNFKSCLEEWEARDSQGRKAAFGDGENYWLYDEVKTDYVKTTDKDLAGKYTKEHNLKWSIVLTLHFVIPKIRTVFGVWRFKTKANKSSIEQIRNTFDAVKEQAGTIINIPFDMNVKKVTSQKPNNKSLFPVVSIIPNISADNVEILRNYLNGGGDILKLGMVNEDKLKALPPSTESNNQ